MKSTLLYYSLKGNTVGILASMREEEFTYIYDMTGNHSNPEDIQKAIDDSDIVFLGTPSYYPSYQLKPDFPKFLEKYRKNLLTLKGKRVILFGSGRSEYLHYCGAQDYFYRMLCKYNIVTRFKFEGYPRQKEIDNFAYLAREAFKKGEGNG